MAFESLFRAHAGRLVAFGMSYVGSRAVAEELVQDLFCRLWDGRFDMQVPENVRAYLFTSLRNRAINHLSRERVSLEFISAEQRATAGARNPAADEQVLAEDLAAALRVAVREMPTRCREVFTLLRDQRMSYAEVAGVLGISVKTVEIHMTRALGILRVRLREWRGAGPL